MFNKRYDTRDMSLIAWTLSVYGIEDVKIFVSEDEDGKYFSCVHKETNWKLPLQPRKQINLAYNRG